MLHRALVRIAQKHLPQDTGAQEVHEVDQGSGHLRARLQVREGLWGLLPQAALRSGSLQDSGSLFPEWSFGKASSQDHCLGPCRLGHPHRLWREWRLLAWDNMADLSLNADSSALLSHQLLSFKSAELGALFATSLWPKVDQLCCAGLGTRPPREACSSWRARPG